MPAIRTGRSTALLWGLLVLLGIQVMASSGEKRSVARDPRALGEVIVFPFIERAGGNEYREVILNEAEKSLSKRGIAILPRAQVLAAARKLGLRLDADASREPGQLRRLGQELAGRYILTGVVHEVKIEPEAGLQPAGPTARIQLMVFDLQTGEFADEFERTVTARPKGLGFRSKTVQLERAVQEATRKSLEPFLAPYKKRR